MWLVNPGLLQPELSKFYHVARICEVRRFTDNEFYIFNCEPNTLVLNPIDVNGMRIVEYDLIRWLIIQENIENCKIH